MKLIILGAGYATRLYPLTLNQPKPLLEVAGKPMIEHVLDNLKARRAQIDVILWGEIKLRLRAPAANFDIR